MFWWWMLFLGAHRKHGIAQQFVSNTGFTRFTVLHGGWRSQNTRNCTEVCFVKFQPVRVRLGLVVFGARIETKFSGAKIGGC